MFVPLKTSRFVREKLPTQLILPPLPHQFCDNSRKNWRLSNPIRYEIGNKKWPWCWVTVSGDHRIGPKSWKMAIIMSRRRGGTWAGVPVATWWSEWICRMRGGLVHHTIMIPAVSSLPLLRGTCSKSCTYNISKWLVLYQNLKFFPVSNFFDCENNSSTISKNKGGGKEKEQFLGSYVVNLVFTIRLVQWLALVFQTKKERKKRKKERKGKRKEKQKTHNKTCH